MKFCVYGLEHQTMQQGAGPLRSSRLAGNSCAAAGAVQTGAVSRMCTRSTWYVLTAPWDRLRCRENVSHLKAPISSPGLTAPALLPCTVRQTQIKQDHAYMWYLSS